MTKKTESNLKRLGVPASYAGTVAILITIIVSQLGVCD